MTIDSLFSRIIYGFMTDLNLDEFDLQTDEKKISEETIIHYLNQKNQLFEREKFNGEDLFFKKIDERLNEEGKYNYLINKLLPKELNEINSGKYNKFLRYNYHFTALESNTLIELIGGELTKKEQQIEAQKTLLLDLFKAEDSTIFNGNKIKSFESLCGEEKFNTEKWLVQTGSHSFLDGAILLKKDRHFKSTESRINFESNSLILNKLCLEYELMASVLQELKNMHLGRELFDAYKETKQNLRSYTFNDISDQINQQILREGFANLLYERVAIRYRHYFIDEFQDTSLVQWENLRSLIHENLSQSEENASAMLVGDPKQAIYHFRGGDVTNFIKLYNKDDKDLSIEARELPFNYRSSPIIIDFINQFFFDYALKQYGFNQNLRNIYHNPTKARQTFGGEVEIKIFDSESFKNQEPLEALYQKIQEIIEKGYSYGDIAILSRRNKDLIEIEWFLRNKGINRISQTNKLDLRTYLPVQLTFYLWKLRYHHFESKNLYQFLIHYISINRLILSKFGKH